MKRSLDGLRRLSGGAIAQVVAGAAARRCISGPARGRRRDGAERIVYFPSCAARNMGAQRGDDGATRCRSPPSACSPRRDSTSSIRTGWPSCAAASRSRARASRRRPTASRRSSERRCATASDDGRLPIVFDTSPCAYRMKRYLPERLAGAGQHRVHPRHGAAARRARAPAASRCRSIRCAACARWARSTSSTRIARALQRRRRRRWTTCCAAASPATRASTGRS